MTRSVRRAIFSFCFLCLTFALLPDTLRAQSTPARPADEDETVGSDFYNDTYFAVGANGSLGTGIGFSGRMLHPVGFSAELTTFVVTFSDDFHFNIGGEAQYAFTRGNSGRFYSLLGAGYFVTTRDSVLTDDDLENDHCDENCLTSPFRLAAGFGYEFFLSKNFTIDPSLQLTWFVGDKQVFPWPSIGFFYYFK